MSTVSLPLPQELPPTDGSVPGRIRAWLAETHPGQTLLYIDWKNARAFIGETMPGAARMELAPTVRASDIPRIRELVRQEGAALASIDIAAREGFIFRPSPTHLRVRDLIARHLGCEPHDIECAVAETKTGRPLHIAVTRWPKPAGGSERAREIWLDLARNVIGHEGWSAYVHGSGLVELHTGERVEFPSALRIDPAEYLRDDIEQQFVLPFGVDGRGRQVRWDITRAPHALIAGLTGSGKTITLYALACAALARGFKLAICEVSKTGSDFDELRPFVETGWWGCDSKHNASVVIQRIYALKDQRMQTLREHGYKKLADVPRDKQRELGIEPIMLLIDEAAALLAAPPTLKGLAKDDPVALANQDEQRDVALAGDAIRRISAELRAAGIHLTFATQTFEVALMAPAGGGVLRANLPFRVLMGRASTTQIAQALMRAQAAETAYELAHGKTASADDAAPELYSQPSPGRGIVETDSATGGFQAVYAPEDEWIAALRSLGVPEPGGTAPTDTSFPTA